MRLFYLTILVFYCSYQSTVETKKTVRGRRKNFIDNIHHKKLLEIDRRRKQPVKIKENLKKTSSDIDNQTANISQQRVTEPLQPEVANTSISETPSEVVRQYANQQATTTTTNQEATSSTASQEATTSTASQEDTTSTANQKATTSTANQGYPGWASLYNENPQQNLNYQQQINMTTDNTYATGAVGSLLTPYSIYAANELAKEVGTTTNDIEIASTNPSNNNAYTRGISSTGLPKKGLSGVDQPKPQILYGVDAPKKPSTGVDAPKSPSYTQVLRKCDVGSQNCNLQAEQKMPLLNPGPVQYYKPVYFQKQNAVLKAPQISVFDESIQTQTKSTQQNPATKAKANSLGDRTQRLLSAVKGSHGKVKYGKFLDSYFKKVARITHNKEFWKGGRNNKLNRRNYRVPNAWKSYIECSKNKNNTCVYDRIRHVYIPCKSNSTCMNQFNITTNGTRKNYLYGAFDDDFENDESKAYGSPGYAIMGAPETPHFNNGFSQFSTFGGRSPLENNFLTPQINGHINIAADLPIGEPEEPARVIDPPLPMGDAEVEASQKHDISLGHLMPVTKDDVAHQQSRPDEILVGKIVPDEKKNDRYDPYADPSRFDTSDDSLHQPVVSHQINTPASNTMFAPEMAGGEDAARGIGGVIIKTHHIDLSQIDPSALLPFAPYKKEGGHKVQVPGPFVSFHADAGGDHVFENSYDAQHVMNGPIQTPCVESCNHGEPCQQECANQPIGQDITHHHHTIVHHCPNDIEPCCCDNTCKRSILPGPINPCTKRNHMFDTGGIVDFGGHGFGGEEEHNNFGFNTEEQHGYMGGHGEVNGGYGWMGGQHTEMDHSFMGDHEGPFVGNMVGGLNGAPGHYNALPSSNIQPMVIPPSIPEPIHEPVLHNIHHEDEPMPHPYCAPEVLVESHGIAPVEQPVKINDDPCSGRNSLPQEDEHHEEPILHDEHSEEESYSHEDEHHETRHHDDTPATSNDPYASISANHVHTSNMRADEEMLRHENDENHHNNEHTSNAGANASVNTQPQQQSSQTTTTNNDQPWDNSVYADLKSCITCRNNTNMTSSKRDSNITDQMYIKAAKENGTFHISPTHTNESNTQNTNIDNLYDQIAEVQKNLSSSTPFLEKSPVVHLGNPKEVNEANKKSDSTGDNDQILKNIHKFLQKVENQAKHVNDETTEEQNIPISPTDGSREQNVTANTRDDIKLGSALENTLTNATNNVTTVVEEPKKHKNVTDLLTRFSELKQNILKMIEKNSETEKNITGKSSKKNGASTAGDPYGEMGTGDAAKFVYDGNGHYEETHEAVNQPLQNGFIHSAVDEAVSKIPTDDMDMSKKRTYEDPYSDIGSATHSNPKSGVKASDPRFSLIKNIAHGDNDKRSNFKKHKLTRKTEQKQEKKISRKVKKHFIERTRNSKKRFHHYKRTKLNRKRAYIKAKSEHDLKVVDDNK